MEEIWKDIKGYEGFYQISNLGNVKSLNYNRTGQEGLIKACNDKYGYLILSLHLNGKRKTYKIHRLVAQAFLNDYSEELEVDHIDTNRKNNNVKNLRMCTRKENDNNPLTRKHKSEAQKGENNSFYGKHLSEEVNKKLHEANKKSVYCIELDKVFDSAKQAGEELKLYANHITTVCKGKYKTTGGYHFQYASDEQIKSL